MCESGCVVVSFMCMDDTVACSSCGVLHTTPHRPIIREEPPASSRRGIIEVWPPVCPPDCKHSYPSCHVVRKARGIFEFIVLACRDCRGCHQTNLKNTGAATGLNRKIQLMQVLQHCKLHPNEDLDTTLLKFGSI
jgi:hypothetical protein